MIKIVTDTASDITMSEAKELQIDVIQIGIQFGEEMFLQEKSEDFARFYKKLMEADELPTTSQPAPLSYFPMFQKAKEDGDDLIYITLSSGLSGTYNTVCLAKEALGYDRVYIVDSGQAIMSQRMIVEQAAKLRDMGKTAKEIVDEIEVFKKEVIVFGIIDTLKYLKKGGRIPPTIANLGELLQIKPVIVVEDTVLKTLGKSRGYASAKKFMVKQIDDNPIDLSLPVYFGYSYQPEKADEFMAEITQQYGIENYKMVPIGAVIGTHLGPNVVAIAYRKK